MDIKDIRENGVLIQEKLLKGTKCGFCNKDVNLQVYHYKGAMEKVAHCPRCNTYAHIPKKKRYSTDFKEIKRPKFLD